MEKMTYVTEDGTILFTPPGTDPDTGCTITGLAADGKYMYLEDIALHLAKTEQRLKRYLDTEFTPEQIPELSRMYREKCEELARLKAQLYPCILAGGKPAGNERYCMGYGKSESDDEPCQMCQECKLYLSQEGN